MNALSRQGQDIGRKLYFKKTPSAVRYEIEYAAMEMGIFWQINISSRRDFKFIFLSLFYRYVVPDGTIFKRYGLA